MFRLSTPMLVLIGCLGANPESRLPLPLANLRLPDFILPARFHKT